MDAKYDSIKTRTDRFNRMYLFRMIQEKVNKRYLDGELKLEACLIPARILELRRSTREETIQGILKLELKLENYRLK